MTTKDCIINNVPIWKLKLEGWRLKWTKDNKSNKVANEVWYIKNESIYKSSKVDFKHYVGNFVWLKDVVDDKLYSDSMKEIIDQRETLVCLFEFYHLIGE